MYTYKYFEADTVLPTHTKKKGNEKKRKKTSKTVRLSAPSITRAGSTVGIVANVHEYQNKRNCQCNEGTW